MKNENIKDQNKKDPVVLLRESKAKYYRNVLKKQESEQLERILKIPDNWAEYKDNNPTNLQIPDAQKKKLSDIKKFKSFELKFESTYIHELTTIEDSIIDSISYRPLSNDMIDETCDSLKHIINDFDSKGTNFKHLLLKLAKRAVSDLYYMVASHHKFMNKTEFSFELHFKDFCFKALNFLKEYNDLTNKLNLFNEYKEKIDRFFSKSSNHVGWKMDEIAVKNFFEKETKNTFIFISEMKKIVTSAKSLKKKIRADFEFIQYYYNDRDGKLFRYNFICRALSQKLEQEKTTPEVFSGFQDILLKFTDLKKHLEQLGLRNFGPPGFSYIETLEFLLKSSKVLEFFYLRSSKYDDLTQFRSETLHYIEKEFFEFNPDQSRTL